MIAAIERILFSGIEEWRTAAGAAQLSRSGISLTRVSECPGSGLIREVCLFLSERIRKADFDHVATDTMPTHSMLL